MRRNFVAVIADQVLVSGPGLNWRLNQFKAMVRIPNPLPKLSLINPPPMKGGGSFFIHF